MENIVQELQNMLLEEIPLTRALGVRVEAYTEEGLILGAPLQPNRNHKSTAFAGSLNALVTLAGWGMCWLIVKELGMMARVVIQDSEIHYLLPVTSNFSALCYKPGQEQMIKVGEMLRKRGKARLELGVQITQDGLPAVTFKGRYVIQSYRSVEELKIFEEERVDSLIVRERG